MVYVEIEYNGKIYKYLERNVITAEKKFIKENGKVNYKIVFIDVN